MKKYISGFVAIVIAVVALSFTTESKVEANKAVGAVSGKFADPCQDSQKRWFSIPVPCNQQTLSLAYLTDYTRYTLFNGTGTTQPNKISDCPGAVCVCAIFACTFVDDLGIVRPVLDAGTTVYTQLQSYVSSGGVNTGTIVIEKQ